VANTQTTFGFYDSDLDFKEDAPKVADWCARRLGYPMVDIELQDKNLYTAFEEAISEYGAQVYQFQIINNLGRVIGTSTGSSHFNNVHIDSNYGNNISSNLGGSTQTSYGVGGRTQRIYSASLKVTRNKQRYDLLSTDPEYAKASIEFTGIPTESQSIELINVGGGRTKYVIHTTASMGTGSMKRDQFGFEESGTTAQVAASLMKTIQSGSLRGSILVSRTGSLLNLTQYTEGIGGNTSIESTLDNTTVTNFTGGGSGLSFEASGSAIQSGVKQISIKKIHHYAPSAINRYFDPYAGTGTGIQSLMQTFGFGNYSPGVNFMLMPIYFDTLKLQAIELNDAIRKSSYHFEINAGRYLRLFPIPNNNFTLWFDYTMADSAVFAGNETANPDQEKPKNLITDMSNMPYTRPTYAYINEPGRQWIRKYALALSKEMLGSIRGKYQQLPIPGSETTLDYARLLSEASAEKEFLIAQLREDLDATTTLKQAERNTAESQQTQEQFSVNDPYQIYIH
jgi:hypothetical protein